MNQTSEQFFQTCVLISDLFVDNEPDIDFIAQGLAKSPYSETELEDILNNKVAPIVWDNLISVAGVWQGFDRDWLKNEILKLEKTSYLKKIVNCIHKHIFPWRTYWIKTEWSFIINKVRQIRANGAQPQNLR